MVGFRLMRAMKHLSGQLLTSERGEQIHLSNSSTHPWDLFGYPGAPIEWFPILFYAKDPVNGLHLINSHPIACSLFLQV